ARPQRCKARGSERGDETNQSAEPALFSQCLQVVAPTMQDQSPLAKWSVLRPARACNSSVRRSAHGTAADEPHNCSTGLARRWRLVFCGTIAEMSAEGPRFADIWAIVARIVRRRGADFSCARPSQFRRSRSAWSPVSGTKLTG